MTDMRLSDGTHVNMDDPTLDGQPQRFCCAGDSVYGPARCTCWETVYDPPEQAEPRTDLTETCRPKMCDDCACRPDSPERTGAEGVSHSGEGELQAILEGDSPFWCHQGMRKRLRLVHPDGSVIDLADGHDSYDPPIVGVVPFKADGTPGDICGGWMAHKLNPSEERK